MQKLTNFIFTLLLLGGTSLSQTTNASVINIKYDKTEAYSEITINPELSDDSGGKVTNPGTSTKTFSGSLFPFGNFSSYDNSIERTAYISYPWGDTDIATSQVVNDFSIHSSGRFQSYIGNIPVWINELEGSSIASVNSTLNFQVTGGDTDIYLLAYAMDNGISSLKLFDESSNTLLADLGDSEPTSFLTLLDSHSYSLIGSTSIFNYLMGDSYATFGFDFGDATISVPEPKTAIFLVIALVTFGFSKRKMLR